MRILMGYLRQLWADRRGEVFVEYILLLTIVGIGVIVGLATLKDALISELNDLAAAIKAIT
jgi:Flp pilus assembly pilin Flp